MCIFINGTCRYYKLNFTINFDNRERGRRERERREGREKERSWDHNCRSTETHRPKPANELTWSLSCFHKSITFSTIKYSGDMPWLPSNLVTFYMNKKPSDLPTYSIPAMPPFPVVLNTIHYCAQSRNNGHFPDNRPHCIDFLQEMVIISY